LFALQHRGQESAGIVTTNGPGASFLTHKDMGLVSQVFGQEELAKLKRHTRRSDTHALTRLRGNEHDQKCANLLWLTACAGQMAIAHKWQFD